MDSAQMHKFLDEGQKNGAILPHDVGGRIFYYFLGGTRFATYPTKEAVKRLLEHAKNYGLLRDQLSDLAAAESELNDLVVRWRASNRISSRPIITLSDWLNR